MENFILWSVSIDQATPRLSFFASAVNLQLINQGTHEMVTRMLADLGLPGVTFEKWTVRHFLTNYLADDPNSDDWEDTWFDTWDIVVPTPSPIQLRIGEAELFRTPMYDESWQGNSRPMPAECVVVSDFYTDESIAKAQTVLERTGNLREDESLVVKLHSEVPQARTGLLAEIRNAYLHQEPPQPLSIRQRADHPRQLILTLGNFDEEFFRDGAKLAALVSELCHALGGTTTWNEKTSPERDG